MDKIKLNYYLKKLKQGKQEYFDKFYNLTKKAAYYSARKYTTNEELIKDVLQESYITFLNNMQNIDEDNNPLSYLLTIVKNKTLDELRKSNKYVDLDEEADIDSMGGKTDQTIYDFPLLEYAKGHLNKEEFYILETTVIQGYKRVEVAKMLDKPVSTINWQYNQVLKKVKGFYKEVYCNENN